MLLLVAAIFTLVTPWITPAVLVFVFNIITTFRIIGLLAAPETQQYPQGLVVMWLITDFTLCVSNGVLCWQDRAYLALCCCKKPCTQRPEPGALELTEA